MPRLSGAHSYGMLGSFEGRTRGMFGSAPPNAFLTRLMIIFCLCNRADVALCQ